MKYFDFLPGFIVNIGGTYGQAISIAGKCDVLYNMQCLYMNLSMKRQNLVFFILRVNMNSIPDRSSTVHGIWYQAFAFSTYIIRSDKRVNNSLQVAWYQTVMDKDLVGWIVSNSMYQYQTVAMAEARVWLNVTAFDINQKSETEVFYSDLII